MYFPCFIDKVFYRKAVKMGAIIDLTGKKFGRLTVIKRVANKGKRARWLCKCECGKTIEVQGTNLKSGNTKSCGCYKSEITIKRNLIHGKRHTKAYNSWSGAKARCYSPESPKYKDYGTRGIQMFERWRNDFQSFYDYVSTLPHFGEKGYTLNRIDNNGNYEPGNVEWANCKEQANNRRSNRLYTYNGETHNISQWAEIIKIPYETLRCRLVYYNWDIDKALNTP